MLEETNERTSSVLVSALGAWLGLGAGLSLMIFSLLAVSWLVVKAGSGSKPSIVLNQRLGRDLTSLQPNGANMSVDGLTLTLKTHGIDGAKTVVYTVWEGRLTRTNGSGDSELVARLDDLRFHMDGNRLAAEWKLKGESGAETWALERWETR
jgi:hypothetical protein